MTYRSKTMSTKVRAAPTQRHIIMSRGRRYIQMSESENSEMSAHDFDTENSIDDTESEDTRRHLGIDVEDIGELDSSDSSDDGNNDENNEDLDGFVINDEDSDDEPKFTQGGLNGLNGQQIILGGSGRGKGGKGLGKGGAKRHRKVLADQMPKALTKPALRRLCRRGGIKRISGEFYEEIRIKGKLFLKQILKDAISYCEHAKRKTLTADDVKYSFKKNGRPIYGGL